MDFVYFIILVSSLIFVHELGHFLFAKAFGVRVITFSLGFGPKILRLRGRETEYCVSLLPLGGYVRMLEESKNDLVLPEDRRRTFESLAGWKRVLIVLAGPAMNLVFPVLLYFSVFVGDGPFLPPTVGVVLPRHPAEGKLFPGDRIMSVSGEEVGTFDEVKRIISKNPGKTVKLVVFRDNRHVTVDDGAARVRDHRAHRNDRHPAERTRSRDRCLQSGISRVPRRSAHLRRDHERRGPLRPPLHGPRRQVRRRRG
jgi:regulator of sigma E protease